MGHETYPNRRVGRFHFLSPANLVPKQRLRSSQFRELSHSRPLLLLCLTCLPLLLRKHFSVQFRQPRFRSSLRQSFFFSSSFVHFCFLRSLDCLRISFLLH